MNAPSLDAILETVGLIYESALDARVSAHAMDGLGILLGSRAVQLCTFDRQTGEVLEAHTDSNIGNQQANQLYLAEWGRLDPRPSWHAKQASGSVFRCHEHFDEAFVAQDPYYQEFFIPHGYRWAMGGMIHASDGTSMVIAGLRAPDAPRYEPWAASLLTSLLPHIKRASIFRSHLANTALAGTDLLRLVDEMPAPCFVVDDRGRLMLKNAAAAVAMSEMGVQLAGAYLHFPVGQTHARWHQTLDKLRRNSLPASLALNPASEARWTLHLLPLKSGAKQFAASRTGVNLVFVERHGGPGRRHVAAFATMFGLSKSETDILEKLSLGRNPKEISRDRGTSTNTVRTQIAHMLEKTGSRTIRELILSVQSPVLAKRQRT